MDRDGTSKVGTCQVGEVMSGRILWHLVCGQQFLDFWNEITCYLYGGVVDVTFVT